MMRSCGFIGFGYCVPEQVRTNGDPIFDRRGLGKKYQGISEADLFVGMRERRVANSEEFSETLMIEAGRRALAHAGIAPRQIDRLYGFASPSLYQVPNGLFQVHHALELSANALVVPINSEFSNFLVSAQLACEAVAAGQCDYAMVNCGGTWTRNMDYIQPHAWSAGDGAAAAVIGPSRSWVWLGSAVHTQTADYHSMSLTQRALDSHPTYRIAEDGVGVFIDAGIRVPPRLMRRLCDRQGITPEQLALITHQASKRLMDSWAAELNPREYPNTLADFGNMALATVGVNLARFYDHVTSDYIGCIGMGAGQHMICALLQRRLDSGSAPLAAT